MKTSRCPIKGIGKYAISIEKRQAVVYYIDNIAMTGFGGIGETVQKRPATPDDALYLTCFGRDTGTAMHRTVGIGAPGTSAECLTEKQNRRGNKR